MYLNTSSSSPRRQLTLVLFHYGLNKQKFYFPYNSSLVKTIKSDKCYFSIHPNVHTHRHVFQCKNLTNAYFEFPVSRAVWCNFMAKGEELLINFFINKKVENLLTFGVIPFYSPPPQDI